MFEGRTGGGSEAVLLLRLLLAAEREEGRGEWGETLAACFVGVAGGEVDKKERETDATEGGSRACAGKEEEDFEMEEDDVVAGGGALREEAGRGGAVSCEGE
jgi:hypothetical protein